MNEEEDVLSELSDTEKKPRNDVYAATAICWTLQNAMALGMFIFPVQMLNGYFASATGIVALVVQVLLARGLGLLALVLLWMRRKSGWVLTLICCTNAVFKMNSSAWFLMRNREINVGGSVWLGTSYLGMYVLSILTLVLCLTGAVRRFFRVTGRQLVWTLVACVIFTILITLLNIQLMQRLTKHS